MTSFPGFSASTTLHSTDDRAPTVTSEVAETTDWTTHGINVSSSLMTSPSSGWSVSLWTTSEKPETDIMTASSSPTFSNSSAVTAEDSDDEVDAAYQRLTNLTVIVAVYSVVLVSMIVFACRRRRAGGFDYRRAGDWTDLEVCGGGHDDDDDDVDDSAAFKRYWDTRRDLAERQRLLDSLRVDNISSVAAGHLIDRLPEDVVWLAWTVARDVVVTKTSSSSA